MLLNQSSDHGRKRVPLWHQIEGVLRHKITTGEHRVGELLPSEPTLAAAFGVNRMTVREALRSLAAEGLIRQVQGKGTYVLRQPNGTSGAGLTTGLVGELEFNDAFPGLSPSQVYQVPDCSLVEVRVVETPPDVRRTLESDETTVVRVERVVTSRGEPFLYVLDYLPRAIGDLISSDDVASSWLTQLLPEKLGYRILEARQTIQASLADTVIGDRLGIPFGSPLLYGERVYIGETGQPLYVAKLWYRGDRFRYAIVFRFRGRQGIDR